MSSTITWCNERRLVEGCYYATPTSSGTEADTPTGPGTKDTTSTCSGTKNTMTSTWPGTVDTTTTCPRTEDVTSTCPGSKLVSTHLRAEKADSTSSGVNPGAEHTHCGAPFSWFMCHHAYSQHYSQMILYMTLPRLLIQGYMSLSLPLPSSTNLPIQYHGTTIETFWLLGQKITYITNCHLS